MVGRIVRCVCLASVGFGAVGLAGCHSTNAGNSTGSGNRPISSIPPASTQQAPKSTAPVTVNGLARPTANVQSQRPRDVVPPPSFPGEESKMKIGQPSASQTQPPADPRPQAGTPRVAPENAFPKINGPFNQPGAALTTGNLPTVAGLPAGGFPATSFPVVAPPGNVPPPAMPAAAVIPPAMPNATVPAVAPPGPATFNGPNPLQTNVYPATPTTLR